MSKNIKIITDPYDLGFDIYKKNEIVLNPGITVLVGCNGIGKTTLLHNIKEVLENEDVPVMKFDNLHDGGINAVSSAGFYGDIKFMASALQSSEGENIILNIEKLAGSIGQFVRKNNNATELFILMDAIDSGLSVDNIIDIKEDLFKLILSDTENKDIYIIISANEYEMANGEQCFDVYNGNYITFNNYDEYRNMIINSKKEKYKYEETKG